MSAQGAYSEVSGRSKALPFPSPLRLERFEGCTFVRKVSVLSRSAHTDLGDVLLPNVA